MKRQSFILLMSLSLINSSSWSKTLVSSIANVSAAHNAGNAPTPTPSVTPATTKPPATPPHHATPPPPPPPLTTSQISNAAGALASSIQKFSYCSSYLYPTWNRLPSTCTGGAGRANWLDAQTWEATLNFRNLYYGASDGTVGSSVAHFSPSQSIVLNNLNGLGGLGLLGLSGVDDTLWWGIASLHVYGVALRSSNLSQLFQAENIFAMVTYHYLDTACGGGVWWDTSKTYKAAIVNELYIDLGMELYDVTGQDWYLINALSVAKWFKAMFGTADGGQTWNYMIQDGYNYNSSTGQCTSQNSSTAFYSYNQGVLLDGFARLSVDTHDDSYHQYARGALQAVMSSTGMGMVAGTTANPKNLDILQEVGPAQGYPSASKSYDSGAFKGAFMRHLGYYLQQYPSEAVDYCPFVQANASQLINNPHTITDYKGSSNYANWYGFTWQYVSSDADFAGNIADTTTSTSALDLFNTAKICNNLGY